MYRNDKVIRRYSEPFKLKILAELTIGKYTKSELCKLYSIAPTTVNVWIKKYNRKDLMNTRVKVETKDEISRIKALQKEVEQLKKLLLKKDLDAMVQDCYLEVAALDLNNFIYYNVLPFRSPAHIVDSSRDFPAPTGDYADGSWTEWLNTIQLEACCYLKSVVEYFQDNTTVTLVRLLRLEAGNTVKEHTDPTLGLQIEKSVIRLTIPIIKEVNADFYLNNSLVDMKPSECWYMRLTDPHRVENNSDTDRINLTIDMIPNEWVRNLILESDQ